MKTAFTFLLAIGLLVAYGGSSDCRGGIIRHDRPAAKYRKLGQASAFQSVGKATVETEPGQRRRYYASAVLIAPRWVLTVAHHAAKKPLEKQRYTFGGEQYRAVRLVVSPGPSVKVGTDGKRAGIAAGADLALVQLDRPVQNVRPATRYRGKDEVGRTMTKVGHGCIGDGLAGMSPLPPTQERRGGNNVIDAAGGKFKEVTVSEHVLVCDFDDPNDPTVNQLGAAKPVELEIGQSVGDSGGGWFIHDDGSWKLVAISSRCLPNKGEPCNTATPKYGFIMAGMRVSTANDWIDGVIGASAAAPR